jgi:hypothetical protein
MLDRKLTTGIRAKEAFGLVRADEVLTGHVILASIPGCARFLASVRMVQDIAPSKIRVRIDEWDGWLYYEAADSVMVLAQP